MKFRNLFPEFPTARYNVAAWQDTDPTHTLLIARDVSPGGDINRPDFGRLVMMELDQTGNILHERVVWEPRSHSFTLEDPRALALSDGTVIVGLTAVLRDENGFLPFPALTRLNARSWKEVLPPVTLIETFGAGKNITPVSEDTFFFRPEEENFFHRLLVFQYKDQIVRKLDEIEFPTTLPWADWRIGTTMSPLWWDEEEALMIIHGIHREGEKYIYSLGRAKLMRQGDYFSVTVHPEPLLTPESFVDESGQPLVNELHPELRRVVYACGGVYRPQNGSGVFHVYVNVGDRTTFEVEFQLEELTRGLWT